MPGSVLLIEDDLDVREIVGQAIVDAGYLAVRAATGRNAVSYLRSNQPPSLILLDWHLPELGGAEVMEEVMSTPALAEVPVVLMTGDIAARGSTQMPFAGLLPKPFTWDDLLSVLTRFLPPRATTPAELRQSVRS